MRTAEEADSEARTGRRGAVDAGRLAARRSEMSTELSATALQISRSLHVVDGDTRDTLLSLRTARRQWRLQPQDWYNLGIALVAGQTARMALAKVRSCQYYSAVVFCAINDAARHLSVACAVVYPLRCARNCG